MTAQTHAYCPECREESAIDRHGRCLWCGGPTRERKRGGWKRPDLRGSRYTEAQLRALHAAHVKGASLNSLAKRTYARVGYTSHDSAASAISREWRRMGLKARERIEQTVISSTKHGLAPKHGPRPGYQAYRRRTLRGQDDRPRCKAKRRQHPRKGEPCANRAMEGSDYCWSHDPRLELKRQAMLVGARRRLGSREMVPMAPLTAWMRCKRDELGSAAALAERLGLSRSSVCNYLHGQDGNKNPKPLVGRETAERLIYDGGGSFEDVYGVVEAA